MFRIENNSVSSRLNDDEKASLTAFLEKYQTQNSITFASFRDFLAHMVNNDGFFMETKEDTNVITVDEIQPYLSAYAERVNMDGETQPIDAVLHALTHIPEPQTVEVEKIVEVEKGPEEVITDVNDLVLHLDDAQTACITDINQNRNAALVDGGHPEETREDTTKGLLFHSGNIHNWAGDFYTGLE